MFRFNFKDFEANLVFPNTLVVEAEMVRFRNVGIQLEIRQKV